MGGYKLLEICNIYGKLKFIVCIFLMIYFIIDVIKDVLCCIMFLFKFIDLRVFIVYSI